MLHGQERAFQVDSHHAVPGVLGKLDDAADLGDPHIVVEQIDAAVFAHAGLHQGFDFGILGDVGAHGEGLAAL